MSKRRTESDYSAYTDVSANESEYNSGKFYEDICTFIVCIHTHIHSYLDTYMHIYIGTSSNTPRSKHLSRQSGKSTTTNKTIDENSVTHNNTSSFVEGSENDKSFSFLGSLFPDATSHIKPSWIPRDRYAYVYAYIYLCIRI